MLNVITTQDIKFNMDGFLMVIPEGSEISVNKEDNSTIIDDYYVTIFPDEYMVIQ